MRYLVMGNWKLNGNIAMVRNVLTELRHSFGELQEVDIAVAPPVMYLPIAEEIVQHSSVKLGAQNVDLAQSGAYTGDISVTMLQEFETKYVIIGHSERRAYHHESNEFIAKKFKILKEYGLTPVLCIGETLAENENGKTKDVCSTQLDAVISYVGIDAFLGAVIAYEPIWAIGTGKSATPDFAQDVHKFIRNHLASYNENIAQKVSILYGGSVNGDNAMSLFAKEDINGALVGGASLKADSFGEIIKAAIIQTKK